MSVMKPCYSTAAGGGVSDSIPLFLSLALSLDMIVLKELTKICSLVLTAWRSPHEPL